MRCSLVAKAAVLLALSFAALGAQAQSSSASSSSVSIPASAADGSLSMIKPAQSASTYYKIAEGNPISFAWNYSDVYVTPSTLIFKAFCSANAVTYDLGSVDGKSSEYVFDPYSYNQNAPKSGLSLLVQGSYKLMVTNPEVTASAAGLVAGNSKVTFAMYNPQAYTPLSEWQCAQCSGASSFLPTRPLVLGAVVSSLAMLLGGYSVLSRTLGI